MAPLRCLTFNIWKNEGDYPQRTRAIAALLRAHRPDVVALQECFIAPALELDSAVTVADGLYHVTRMPARTKPRRHEGAWCDSRSDMVILTREAPLACGTTALPADPRDGERGLLWVEIAFGTGTVRIGCTHLTHLQDVAAHAVRARQAEAALAALVASPGPWILMGDLNAASDAPSLAPIFGDSRLCASSRVLAAPPPGPRPENGAIDHVLLFAAPGSNARMLARRIIAAPDRDGFPSDHPAVLAEITLP